MDNKQIHFSINKNLLILVSIIIAALLIIIVCLSLRGGMHREMMMRQGQRGEYNMMQDRQGGTRGVVSPGQTRGQMMPVNNPPQPTSGAVGAEGSTTIMSN